MQYPNTDEFDHLPNYNTLCATEQFVIIGGIILAQYHLMFKEPNYVQQDLFIIFCVFRMAYCVLRIAYSV